MKFKNKEIVLFLALFTSLLVIYPSFIALAPNNTITSNNKLVPSQAGIENGLLLNYTFTIGGVQYKSGFSYTHESGNFFNVSWWVEGSDTANWLEDESNRLISMSNGLGYFFNDGSHAPTWIFTNTSINDVILISCDALGDFSYTVTKEFTYNLLGFGAIEVWQLDNLPLGYSVWYEKSTGLLIKGMFPVFTGNYTLEITNINTNLNYVQPISGLFDGLYIHHNFSLSGAPSVTSNFTYQEYMPNIFNVTLSAGPAIWSVEVSTRIISYSMGALHFGSGTHEPAWIHTNVTLNDLVPIAMDGVGDYMFNITGDFIYDLVGFGLIEVWILENLATNSTAWYEKSTGILIKGTFIWGVGNNYTLDFIDTNALFQYYTPPAGIPGYDIVLFAIIIGVVSLIMVIYKRRKLI